MYISIIFITPSLLYSFQYFVSEILILADPKACAHEAKNGSNPVEMLMLAGIPSV